MFVAFDFEEWENKTLPDSACTKLGCGSRDFVANFSQYYNKFPNMSNAQFGQLQGVIIMDTMMNYNSNPNSQDLVPKIKKFFPEVYHNITANDKRGDFLVAVGRKTNDNELLNTFSHYYKKQQTKGTKDTFSTKILLHSIIVIIIIQCISYDCLYVSQSVCLSD
jgi:hypothetical protein